MQEQIWQIEQRIEQLEENLEEYKNFPEQRLVEIRDCERELEQLKKELAEAKKLEPHPLRWCEFYEEESVFDRICEALSKYENEWECQGTAYINVDKSDSYVRLENHAATNHGWRCIYTIEDENLCGEQFFEVANKILSKLEEDYI